MIKGSMQQKELTILNIYATNTGVARNIKHVLNDLQRDLDSCKIIVGDLNTPLSILDQQENPGLKHRYGPSGPNRHLLNSPSQIHRIYILLRTTSHLLQNLPRKWRAKKKQG